LKPIVGDTATGDDDGHRSHRLTLAIHPRRRHLHVMLNLFSILIGLVALVLGIVPFLPFLAWGYWFVIPIAVVGAAVGALSSRNTGRNLNLVLILIFGLRLMIGGGVI
jgi:hypothetical protein